MEHVGKVVSKKIHANACHDNICRYQQQQYPEEHVYTTMPFSDSYE